MRPRYQPFVNLNALASFACQGGNPSPQRDQGARMWPGRAGGMVLADDERGPRSGEREVDPGGGGQSHGHHAAVIARLEGGRVKPSTRTLERFAKATALGSASPSSPTIRHCDSALGSGHSWRPSPSHPAPTGLEDAKRSLRQRPIEQPSLARLWNLFCG
jgi:hypothetical protein